MYRFPCFHAIRRPNISLTFIARFEVRRCGASSDHDVNNNIHKTQPRRSTLVRVALVLPPARILREYDPGTYRSRAAVASSLAPRDNFFSARHRLRFLSAPPCTVARRGNHGTGMVALTAPPAGNERVKDEDPRARSSARARHTTVPSCVDTQGNTHACKSSDCIRDDSAKSDTSTQGIRHPIPTTPPGDPHNAFS